MPPCSLRSALYKIRCGNYIYFILKSGLRTTYSMDKTIAHTNMITTDLLRFVCIKRCGATAIIFMLLIKVAKFDLRR